MPRCRRCNVDLREGASHCASCGASAPLAKGEETLSARALLPQAPAHDREGQNLDADPAMLPGTVIAGRYRVIALVGRGGMGEVYRADDLKLGQPVALKFLPRAAERDGTWLSRLLDEVRIARQISHPNVCRVYDVADAGGRHFLSMEFIDGEDLASLLRRIGRVPPEKALQIARQLCAGLAAAHDQRVLHRDLKPANIMIDGRGRARITDFGLAVLEQRIPHQDVTAGTPAYMAPEQLAGRDVTARSDLYSLGLVLYELFSGKPAFERAANLKELRELRTSPPPTPSSHTDGLDPSIERVILRCLEPDPALRPASALAVASALPGGDPLAVALAAGETPSPEIVAAAPQSGALHPAAAAAALLATLLLWSLTFILAIWPLRHLTFERSPEALADRAHDLLQEPGDHADPVDRAWGYLNDDDLLLRLGHQPSPELVASALAGRAAVVRFWYRESSTFLVPWTSDRVSPEDPPIAAPGSSLVEMTTGGRLLSLRRVPEASERADGTIAPDWSALFHAASLRLTDFDAVQPAVHPPDFADTRVAWQTRFPEPQGELLRVEAAARHGEPVFFRVAPALAAEVVAPPESASARKRLFFFLLGALFTAVLVAALWLARRNERAARADRQGATRIASVVFAVELGVWVLSASHAPVLDEFWLFFRAAAWALFKAGVVWVFYLALEPLLRRRSPTSLVSWARLLAGRWKDALVGRDLLLGSLIGAAQMALAAIFAVWLWKTGQDPAPGPAGVINLIGVPGLFRVSGGAIVTSFIQAMAYLVLWQVFSWALRSSARGTVALGVLMLLGLSIATGSGVGTVFHLSIVTLTLLAITRLGLLALVASLWILHLTVFFPLWADPSAWFFGESVVIFLLGAAPAVWGAWTASRGGSPTPPWTGRAPAAPTTA